MKDLYQMIFKRKSIRRFDETLFVSKEELDDLKNQFKLIHPLRNDIKIYFEVVKRSKTTSKRGEYCLLMYSEQKDNFLINAGYMLEQIDLYLATHDIGVCWYGIAKPEELQHDGLDYVIMLAFGKCHPKDFRKDLMKCSRKSCEVIWNGEFDDRIVNLVRYAPSSCNMQPWRVISEQNCIKVYRTTEVNSIMPVNKRPFYNSIDMGIFLCFLEILLEYYHYRFERSLSFDQNTSDTYIEVATYIIYPL